MKKKKIGHMHTKDAKKKTAETHAKSKAILEKFGFQPTMARAIREHCIGCQGESRMHVKLCNLVKCPLWPFRMGKKPREEDMFVAQFAPDGSVSGKIHISEVI